MKLAALIVVLLVINSCYVEACPLGILYKIFRVYEWSVQVSSVIL